MASTKAFTSQVIILALSAIFLGRERGFLSASKAKKIIKEIEKLPMLIKTTLAQEDKIKSIAKNIKIIIISYISEENIIFPYSY